MLAFLNIGARFTVLIPLIVISWSLIMGLGEEDVLFGGVITEMPFGLQDSLQFFANTIAVIVYTMPWFEVIFDIMLWGVQIKLLLMSVSLFRWIISLFVN